MTTVRLGLLLCAMALALSSLGGTCQQPNVPTPDASDAVAPPPPQPPLADSAPPPATACAAGTPTDDCVGACTKLLAFGCTTGAKADCACWAQRDLGSGLVPNPVTHHALTCAVVAGLTSKAGAVAVGFVCP